MHILFFLKWSKVCCTFAHRFDILVVANAKLQIFGDLPKGLSPFLSA